MPTGYILAVLAAILGGCRAADMPPLAIDATTREWHEAAVVADAHADSLMWNRDLNQLSVEGEVDIPKLRIGGVDVQCFTIVTRGFPIIDGFWLFAMYRGWPRVAAANYVSRTQWQIAQLERFVRQSGGKLVLAQYAEDFDRYLRQGKIAAVLGIEGAHALGGDLRNVQRYFDQGVRFMSLTHLTNNELGGSSSPTFSLGEIKLSGDRGLTPYGEAVVREMNRVGMIVDLAHASLSTFRDIVQINKGPVLVSHTGVSAVHKSSRNLTDEQIDMIAAHGGVMGIFLDRHFLGTDRPEGYIDNIDYIAKRVGVDHVGLGSDFDGFITPPREIRDVRNFPLITQLLRQRGYTREEIEKILGGNFLRLFRKSFPRREREGKGKETVTNHEDG